MCNSHESDYFHPDKHRVDCEIYLNFNEDYEFGISCFLDGEHCLDHVGLGLVAPVMVNGKWECAECYKTGDPAMDEDYVRARFDTREALLLDHMKATLEGIKYLSTARRVEVYLGNPNNPGDGSSGVWLRENPFHDKSGHSFLIPIGKVELMPCADEGDPVAIWIQDMLAKNSGEIIQNS